MKNPIIIAAIVAILVGAGAFFGGMKYQETKAASGNHNQFSGRGGQNFRQGMGNNQPVRGEIISFDQNSVTVKMQDGSSKIVLLSDTTAITEATSASKQSLTTGKQIMVFGNNNSDGSVTAQNIQLNPIGGFGRDNGANHQGDTPSGSPR